jgi:hypothetical protein
MTFAFNFKNERTFVFSLFYRFSHVADWQHHQAIVSICKDC